MRTLAWTLACTVIFSTGCASERVMEKPVPVEITRTVYVPIPADLLREQPKTTISETLTYGQAILRWDADRSSLAVCNARLRAIAALPTGGPPGQ